MKKKYTPTWSSWWCATLFATFPCHIRAFVPTLDHCVYGVSSDQSFRNIVRLDEGQRSNDGDKNIQARRDFFHTVLVTPSVVGGLFLCHTKEAVAANLPQSTGADLSKTGTLETLVPVVEMRNTLQRVQAKLKGLPPSDPISSQLLKIIMQDGLEESSSIVPSTEMTFKRILDEYSDPVSYKQKFMDQNAFLVYYSKGFDGPNRPTMESGEVPKQTYQYGARNDAWTAYNDVLAELAFCKKEMGASNVEDILQPLNRTIAALDDYLSLAPPSDVNEAFQILAAKEIK